MIPQAWVGCQFAHGAEHRSVMLSDGREQCGRCGVMRPLAGQELSRRSDPATSRKAASTLVHSGRRRGLAARAHAMLQQQDGQTYSEIAAMAGLRPDQIWRRMSDLKNWGLVHADGERMGHDGKMQQIWWLIGE